MAEPSGRSPRPLSRVFRPLPYWTSAATATVRGATERDPGGQVVSGGGPGRLVAVHHRQVPAEHDHVVGRKASLRRGGRAAVNEVHSQAGVAQSLLRDPAGQHPPSTIVRQRT